MCFILIGIILSILDIYCVTAGVRTYFVSNLRQPKTDKKYAIQLNLKNKKRNIKIIQWSISNINQIDEWMNEKEHKNGLTLSFEENILFYIFKYYLRRNNRNYLNSIKQKKRDMVGVDKVVLKVFKK